MEKQIVAKRDLSWKHVAAHFPKHKSFQNNDMMGSCWSCTSCSEINIVGIRPHVVAHSVLETELRKSSRSCATAVIGSQSISFQATQLEQTEQPTWVVTNCRCCEPPLPADNNSRFSCYISSSRDAARPRRWWAPFLVFCFHDFKTCSIVLLAWDVRSFFPFTTRGVYHIQTKLGPLQKEVVSHALDHVIPDVNSRQLSGLSENAIVPWETLNLTR